MGRIDFNAIYTKNYHRSFLFVKSYVQDEMAAEDIVAESLIKFWELTRQSTEEMTEALLLTILKNKSLDYLRTQARHAEALEKWSEAQNRELNLRITSLDACDPQEIFSKEIMDIFHQTLASLPPQTQQIFRLSRVENKSVKEIAELMQLSPKSVEYHITKALKEMRIALKDYLPFLLFLIQTA